RIVMNPCARAGIASLILASDFDSGGRFWRRFRGAGSGEGPLLDRLREGYSLEDFSHQNVRLSCRQAISDEVFVNAQTKHRSGVAWRLKLNHDLSDHSPSPPSCPDVRCGSAPRRSRPTKV